MRHWNERVADSIGERSALAFGPAGNAFQVGLGLSAAKTLLDLLGFVGLFGGDCGVNFPECGRKRVGGKFFSEVDPSRQLSRGERFVPLAPGDRVVSGL